MKKIFIYSLTFILLTFSFVGNLKAYLRVTKECPVNATFENPKTGTTESLEIVYFMNSRGEKRIKIDYNGDNAESLYSTKSTTEVNVGGTIFYFYPDDADNIFKQTKRQKDLNTFTCPSKTLHIRPSKGSSSEGNKYVSSYSSKVLNEYAEEDTSSEEEPDGSNSSVLPPRENESCVDYLGHAKDDPGSVAAILDDVYTVIKIGSIIVLIVLSLLDFAGAITKNKDELMPTVKKFGTRLIILVLILLIPSFIDLLGRMFGIPDILCGIK